ncbi:hypothetical protein EDD16DRAFT_1614898 [Pisolithus croceorrhizus]|nr:hypothetical protein EDD16DRAFT_1614898 [Pisolithus croceorrhizus]KAI6167756.1 hypothetical protein EDD17DRAFT_861517 [Pisolithus thermaeus]
MPSPNSATNRSLYTWLPGIYMSRCALGLSSREDKTLASAQYERDKTGRKPSETKAKDIQVISRFRVECFLGGHYVVNWLDVPSRMYRTRPAQDRRCSRHGIVLLPFYKLPFPKLVRFALQARTRNLILDHWLTHRVRQNDYSSIRNSRCKIQTSSEPAAASVEDTISLSSPAARTSGHVQNLVVLCSNRTVHSPSEVAYWWR